MVVTISWATVFGFLVTLVAIFSPIAAAAAFGPLIGRFDSDTRRQIALTLFVVVAGLVVVAILVGEFIAAVLGVNETILMAVGGLALLLTGVPMMTGRGEWSDTTTTPSEGPEPRWTELVATPLVFPISFGGAIIAISVASSGPAQTVGDFAALTGMAVVYGLVVGVTAYIGGAIPERLGPTGRSLLSAIGGVLLTGIGISLLVTSITEMVQEALKL